MYSGEGGINDPLSIAEIIMLDLLDFLVLFRSLGPLSLLISWFLNVLMEYAVFILQVILDSINNSSKTIVVSPKF